MTTMEIAMEEEPPKDREVLLEEFERRKKVRQINVSTDDAQVKKNLRQLGVPICLFGEGPADRRTRLRELIASLGEDAIKKDDEKAQPSEKDNETTWYHKGPDDLLNARRWIGHYSFKRANERLDNARRELELPATTRTAHRQELLKKLQALSTYCSQIGDVSGNPRPLSHCEFSPNSRMLATASWSGICNLWSVPDCQIVRTIKGHRDKVECITWHPKATITEEVIGEKNGTTCVLATCSYDGSVNLWGSSSGDEPLAKFEGHDQRVSMIQFHPSGRFLGTCCYDESWRLWDLEQQVEVLHQEGHSRAVHCMSFQIDGSVVATGSTDAFGRVWDLRSGRCIMLMEGHLESILGIDFSPNGFHIATGSQDNTCKIWDFRKRSCIYTIPAHTNLLSSVKYQREKGDYLVTASFDCTAKIWSNKTWQLLKTLSGHDNKIFAVDVSPNDEFISTCSQDRTFKLWHPENISG